LKRKIIIAITGASGAIYAKQLLEKIFLSASEFSKIDIIFSGNALDVWEYELGNKSYQNYNANIIDPEDFFTRMENNA